MFQPSPKVSEVKLNRHYSFMYENFVILTQQTAYLLLEKSGDIVHALSFDSPNCKYGGPNDEVHGAHPLAKHGLGFYGLYEVDNSPWLREMMVANRVHPGHTDALFAGRKHFVACFKDVKFECACTEMKEIALSESEIATLLKEQLQNLKV